ncbi:hypothetical protein [Aeromonas veronii]|uniref:hypothetical protein n=1 Tax=Aeromonas TaxID=642 RepID=UPI0021E71BBB|nr:hypothetical protein [Aeromonas veronii]MCV3282724.1 hypothetical protein [Aeromonas veronii]
MELLIKQLENSLESRNYYLSLFTALTLPDIAGAMDSDDGLASGAKYKSWYEKWVRPRFYEMLIESLPVEAREYMSEIENPFDGDACYLFRCSLLHQGRTVHPKNKYSRIFFVEPGATTSTFHYNTMNDALNIDLVSFCREIIAGAKMWLAEVKNTDKYKRNYENFVKRHDGGLSPFIVGVPVIG